MNESKDIKDKNKNIKGIFLAKRKEDSKNIFMKTECVEIFTVKAGKLSYSIRNHGA